MTMSSPQHADPRSATEPTWVHTAWDDPRTAAMSDAMDEELVPRYARLRIDAEKPGTAPASPTSDDVAVVVIAEIDGNPAAAGTLRRLPDRWEIKRLFVHPDFRRLGLAKATLQRLEAAAAERGATAVFLQTGILQPDAIGLYEREGWERIPAFAPYSDDDGISVCFRKDLPEH